jgi:hypothetical protein
MKKINACSLKLVLDNLNYYEEGIVEIIKTYMDFNLLLYNLYKIKLEVDTDFFRIFYFDLKENIQIHITLKKNNDNKKIIKVDERQYYKNSFIHHKILDTILNKSNYLTYKNPYFYDKKLRNTKMKSYFCLLINSFITISYKYKFDNLVKIMDGFKYK